MKTKSKEHQNQTKEIELTVGTKKYGIANSWQNRNGTITHNTVVLVALHD